MEKTRGGGNSWERYRGRSGSGGKRLRPQLRAEKVLLSSGRPRAETVAGRGACTGQQWPASAQGRMAAAQEGCGLSVKAEVGPAGRLPLTASTHLEGTFFLEGRSVCLIVVGLGGQAASCSYWGIGPCEGLEEGRRSGHPILPYVLDMATSCRCFICQQN